MTLSRGIGIASGAGAALSAIGSTVNIINPKWGAILAGIGAAITMFCERAHGSPEYRRIKRIKRLIRETEPASVPEDAPMLRAYNKVAAQIRQVETEAARNEYRDEPITDPVPEDERETGRLEPPKAK